MENNEIKSLRRQRSMLIVIVVVLAFVTLVSVVYALIQKAIADKNFQQAQKYETLAQENATKAERLEKEALMQMKLAERAVAQEQILRAKETRKKSK